MFFLFTIKENTASIRTTSIATPHTTVETRTPGTWTENTEASKLKGVGYDNFSSNT